MITVNQRAFLGMLAHSEIGTALLATSDNGYNVIVGSTAAKPILFSSYADHPRRLIEVRPGLKSTAAGRYQILARYYDAYKKTLGLPDFSPYSQDAIALQMMKEQGVMPLLAAGNFADAVRACSNIWASLPGAGYDQHENSFENLQAAYVQAGGMLA